MIFQNIGKWKLKALVLDRRINQRTNLRKNHIINHKEAIPMLEFVCNTIFWTLALYGLLEIIKTILQVSMYTKMKADGTYVIIAVKNQEEKIEGFLRATLFKILYGREDYLKNIMVADLGSTDNTKEIAKKLAKDYEILKVVSWKECEDLMNNIDDI